MSILGIQEMSFCVEYNNQQVWGLGALLKSTCRSLMKGEESAYLIHFPHSDCTSPSEGLNQ